MTKTPAFAHAADIEASLERVAERGVDPTPLVYERLFALHPQMRPHFWRDTDGAVKGEMLARTFAAILDFVGDRAYADHMIGTELVTHEGYDVPREIFASFFRVIRDTLREMLGPEWTPRFERAWDALLAEIDRYVGMTPRIEVSNAHYQALLAEFEGKGVS